MTIQLLHMAVAHCPGNNYESTQCLKPTCPYIYVIIECLLFSFFCFNFICTIHESQSLRDVLDSTLCDKFYQRIVVGLWFCLGTAVSSTIHHLATLHISRRDLRKRNSWPIIGLFYVPLEFQPKIKTWIYHHSTTEFLNYTSVLSNSDILLGVPNASRNLFPNYFTMYRPWIV